MDAGTQQQVLERTAARGHEVGEVFRSLRPRIAQRGAGDGKPQAQVQFTTWEAP